MSRIGFGEILVILVLALLVIGPDKLPELARSLGKAVRAMKKTIQETTEELDGAEDLKELRDEVECMK
ncbi:MAG: Sec-independent protein translocase protein TatB, partial [Oscillospiraceae bacterium]|nr:Sec-independent protein translocase protein TatB [Oscillospiraceae bacterium]